jgi:hypothetical protein
MFAPAYMGRKRWAQPFQRSSYVGRKTVVEEEGTRGQL